MLRLSVRPGRPAQPSAARIAPCSAVVPRPACQGRRSALRRRREAPGAGPGRQPGAVRPELRLRVRLQEALHPVDPGPESLSGQRPGPVLHRDVRAAALRRRAPAWPSELARRREPASAILQPEACRDGLRAAVRPDGPVAVQRACCRGPGSQSVREMLSVRVWLLAQVRPDAPRVRPPEQGASPWARAAPREAVGASGPGEPRARAAAEPPRAAVAWEPDVLRAVSEHAAAEPRPVAAKAVSVRQAAEVAAAGPDEPQGEAEVAAALRGAAVRQPAAARRAVEAVRLRGAVRPGGRGLLAARLPAVPSEAASVFRQGPSLVAGPARPRAAAHFAHAMRSLRTASR